jgi:hypothetical protein
MVVGEIWVACAPQCANPFQNFSASRVRRSPWWPHPMPMWPDLWSRFGKANQDVDFAEDAWAFFQRHRRRAK